ncbi:hypothetical protein Rhopal_006881-T1 [Rhodotorula paludigena]|uniref:DH domain-containing protein n=1 Tax=Rhodotorula paludigena TaxID=86838 RepID=A0AAV5GUA7_9BASI|nr:hypothetical protein Rhopal_006881-T1 [Rhodotorula paludigena]
MRPNMTTDRLGSESTLLPSARQTRPTYMRTRQTSMPASLIRSRHQSIVGSAGLTTTGSFSGADKRVSVASVSSFESLPEEGEDDGAGAVSSDAVADKRALARRPYIELDVSTAQTVESARLERAAKRWRIAEELKETEKAYVQVLEEIDAVSFSRDELAAAPKMLMLASTQVYYRPLIEALPADDPLSRRSSKRYSLAAGQVSPNASPRHSAYAPSLPRTRTSTAESLASSSPSDAGGDKASSPTASSDPVLSRRTINEIFSNFTDVLNLSHFLLVTLDEAIPPRPSQPVSISPKASLSPLAASTVSSTAPQTPLFVESPSSFESGQLSKSNETESSTGPDTPPPPAPKVPPASIPSASIGRQRKISTRHPRRSLADAAPPLRLGKALLPVLPFLKQYSLFVANFSSSLSRLSSLDSASPSASTEDDCGRWTAFVAAQQTQRSGDVQGKIGLGGLLLNIVQRVPRYRLLLHELLQHTEDDHPDRPELQKAFEIVDGVAAHLDSQISAHTNSLAILDLQRAFLLAELDGRVLLAPGRQLLKSDTVRQISYSGDLKSRVLFLFSDLLLVAAIAESWPGLAGATETQYRLKHWIELESVTVVGRDAALDEGLRYGFEVLSPGSSFALCTDSLDAKNAWLDAMRDAKAALTSDRATLQKTTSLEQLAPPLGGGHDNKLLDRRISLPVASPSLDFSLSPARSHSTSARSRGQLGRMASTPPGLGCIPPTPAEELDQLAFPSSPSITFVQSPLESPALFPHGDAAPVDSAFTLPAAVIETETAETRLARSRRPPLARARRWSEMNPTSAFRALSSVLPTDSAPPSDLADDGAAYPVVDSYQAPVWVPDSKAYFIIPSAVLSPSAARPSSNVSSATSTQPDRLARACDSCYTSVFAPPAPASRFLASHPTTQSFDEVLTDMTGPPGKKSIAATPAGTGSVRWTGTWRLSKAVGGPAGLDPLFDLEDAALSLGLPGEARAGRSQTGKENEPIASDRADSTPPRRTRKTSAVNQLRDLLRR